MTAGLGSLLPLSLEAIEARETAIKAAYLYNFTQFVEWPETAFHDPDQPFIIGVYGPNPFGRLLDEIVQGQQVSGRRIETRYLSDTREIPGCHILFISRTANLTMAELDAATAARPVLTVSDARRFARHGGMVGFVTDRNRVRFEVNLGSARQAGLNLSSRMLRLAIIINREDY